MCVSLGKKIRGLRDELGISQAQLASQAELSQGYLSQLENDEVQNPSAAVIFRLALAMHIDPRVLMQAAGYADIAKERGNGGRHEVSVHPVLLSLPACIPSDHQERLLTLL